jgi:quinol monooxygenase YgiN
MKTKLSQSKRLGTGLFFIAVPVILIMCFAMQSNSHGINYFEREVNKKKTGLQLNKQGALLSLLSNQLKEPDEMTKLEVSARMTIRKGKLDGFKQQAAECIRQTIEKDTKTLRYDWFINAEGTQCEIRELYESSDGMIEHKAHIGEALDKLFTEFADDHAVTVYGNPSKEFVEMANTKMPGKVKWYSFFKGMENQ